MTIIEKQVYRTLHWTILFGGETYIVQCQEGTPIEEIPNDPDSLPQTQWDDWFIEKQGEGYISTTSPVALEIIDFCLKDSQ